MEVKQDNHVEKGYLVVVGCTDDWYKGDYEFEIKNKDDVRELHRFVSKLGVKPGSRVGFDIGGYEVEYPIHNYESFFCNLDEITEADEELFRKIERNELKPDEGTYSRYLDYLNQHYIDDLTLDLSASDLIEPLRNFYKDLSKYFEIDQMLFQDYELIFRGSAK